MATPEGGYINIYFADVTDSAPEGAIVETAGQAGEKALSSGDATTNPLTVTINSSQGEKVFRKCGIRTANGYETVGTTTISFEGGTDLAEQNAKYAGKTSKICWRIAATKAELEAANIDSNNVDSNESCMSLPLTGINDTKNTLFYIMVLSVDQENPTVDTSVKIVTTATIAAKA